MISDKTIQRLIKDQRGICPLCGRDLYRGYHVHHACITRDIHFSKWLDMPENLVLLCPRCHGNHGSLTNFETRKAFWKLKIEQGYDMQKWQESIPMIIRDKWE